MHGSDVMRERFIVNMCLTEIFHIFDIPETLLQSITIDNKSFKCSKFHSLEGNEDFVATWLPKNRVTFGIYINRYGNTLIALDGRIYLSSADLMLDHSLAKESFVLAHYTEDQVSLDSFIPKILIYDAVYIDSKCLLDVKPFERYKMLLSSCNIKKSNPIYSIQWVGFEKSVIENFDSLKISIPHDVDHLSLIHI